MVLKEVSLKIADCGLWGFGPHNFIYSTDVSAGPSDIIFRRFYFEEGSSGFFSGDARARTHTSTHTHTPTGLLTTLLSIVTTMLTH